MVASTFVTCATQREGTSGWVEDFNFICVRVDDAGAVLGEVDLETCLELLLESDDPGRGELHLVDEQTEVKVIVRIFFEYINY